MFLCGLAFSVDEFAGLVDLDAAPSKTVAGHLQELPELRAGDASIPEYVCRLAGPGMNTQLSHAGCLV